VPQGGAGRDEGEAACGPGVAVLANAVARMVWECGWYKTAYLHQRTDMILFNDYTAKALQLGMLGESPRAGHQRPSRCGRCWIWLKRCHRAPLLDASASLALC
jgi:hypothetical protein